MTLRLLLTESSLKGTFVAVGLDRYIVGQGDTPDEAFLDFQAMFASELAYGIQHMGIDNALHDIPGAPEEYWKKYEESRPATVRNIEPITIVIGDEWKTTVRPPYERVEVHGAQAATS